MGVIVLLLRGPPQVVLFANSSHLQWLSRLHLAGHDPADYPVKILVERGTFSPSPRSRAG